MHIAVGERENTALASGPHVRSKEARLTVERQRDRFEREVGKTDIESRADCCRRDAKTERNPWHSSQLEEDTKNV